MTQRPHRPTQADIDARYRQIIAWRDTGKTRVEIAALLRISRQRVQQLEQAARDQAAYSDAKKAALRYLDSCTETPLQTLDLDRRTLMALQRYGLRTIGDVLQCSDDELLEIRRVGNGNLQEIRAAIERAHTGVMAE
jgi:DNA-directed RNA polymerase alpha subunit